MRALRGALRRAPQGRSDELFLYTELEIVQARPTLYPPPRVRARAVLTPAGPPAAQPLVDTLVEPLCRYRPPPSQRRIALLGGAFRDHESVNATALGWRQCSMKIMRSVRASVKKCPHPAEKWLKGSDL